MQKTCRPFFKMMLMILNFPDERIFLPPSSRFFAFRTDFLERDIVVFPCSCVYGKKESMKKVVKNNKMHVAILGNKKAYGGGQTGKTGFWTVRHGVNHPLMFRLLLVRYLIVFCFLLALFFTVSFYVRRGRQLHVSPQADMPEWITGEQEKYTPEGEQI